MHIKTQNQIKYVFDVYLVSYMVLTCKDLDFLFVSSIILFIFYLICLLNLATSVQIS